MTKQINNLIFAVGLVLITLCACDDDLYGKVRMEPHTRDIPRN